MVAFDQEISSGIWEFTAKGNIIKNAAGIGIIDASQTEILHPFIFRSSFSNKSICYIGKTPYIKGLGKINSENQEIKPGDEVRAIVDFESNSHTFSLRINNEIQPFCVTHIPDRVKFILVFSAMNVEWEFISLKELNKRHGAYGTVYLSFNNELDIIAAKVMRIEKFDEREWDAAGKLNQHEFQCPFIMKYLRAKAFQTDALILMEYANAKSLDSIVKDKTKNLSNGTYRAL
ncbi:MAG: hypothetical protein EZS28_031962 [Streblomastix strix]|uniref:Protein kinase domain-containing protein n=1 Tax=Streblomastix strix TaxID=222440 RepID=A0A5J4UR62_9EUKA|nr:MAG: hypothetical protein EZS28_031962 [Streblomastix strix]